MMGDGGDLILVGVVALRFLGVPIGVIFEFGLFDAVSEWSFPLLLVAFVVESVPEVVFESLQALKGVNALE